MNVPAGYDPVLLNHWLWYKHQCHECSPADFQRLFENVIKRVNPKFMPIRPYGNIGDRKCDGLYFESGMVFQVYAPDEFKQNKLISKIEEDLDGAVRHWGTSLKEWVFVYNSRRGLPPDIPAVLSQEQKKYPNVTLHHWSSDHLWEMVRALPLQQRVEILGAPSGYEHLFLANPVESGEAARWLRDSWFVLVQDVMSPVNLASVAAALAPHVPFGAPLHIHPTPGPLPWNESVAFQEQAIAEALAKGRDFVPRYAVFSLAPIPLAVHLGFLLSDRVEVRCYQFHRNQATWCWPAGGDALGANDLTITGIPKRIIHQPTDVSLRVSLSARVRPEHVGASLPGKLIDVHIQCKDPSIFWLRSPDQCGYFTDAVHRVLKGIRDMVPQCRRIHLFYAGPTPCAVILGQQINPRMSPPVDLFEFSSQTDPPYRYALTLKGADK